MAGGEPRFGTTAIYMPTLLLQQSDSVKQKYAHTSLVTCQHSASEDLNNVLISRDFSGQLKRELQVNADYAPQIGEATLDLALELLHAQRQAGLGSRRFLQRVADLADLDAE